MMLAQAFRCVDCGSATYRLSERGSFICAACFPVQTLSVEPDDLAETCAHCAAPVARYDASGRAWCDRCYIAYADQRKPLSGVLCPNCQQSQSYTHTPDRVWCCTSCQQSYSWSCFIARRKPSFPLDSSPILSTYPHHTTQKEEPMPKRTQPALTTMPEPIIRLSHSQMDTWQQCQLRWRLQKIDKLPAAPAEALILGTAFHAALEADGIASERLTDYQLLGIFEKAFQAELANADPTGLITNDKRIALRRKAQLMITEYIRTVQPYFAPLDVEQDFILGMSDDVHFVGRIDAITPVSIVDWKTANKPWQLGDQDHKDQATAYLIARPDQTRVSFAVFAPDGESCSFQSLPTTRTEEQKALYRAKVLRVADEMRAAKASGNFPANPGPLCGWCNHLGSCSAGEAWLKLKGRVPAVPVLRTTQTPQPTESEV